MTPFDPSAATAAYLATIPPQVLARAVAYTQGSHWVLLGSAVVSVVAALAILRSGVLAALERRVQRRRPRPRLVSFLASVAFVALDFVLELPWQVWAGWARLRHYGLTSQPLAGWFGELVMGTAIGALFTGLFLMALYTLIRRSPRRWWAWSGLLAAAFVTIALVLGPVLVEPLFNHYDPAPTGPVRDAVVKLARETGVPSDKIYVYNGSKQSNAYTANVSGVAGSARVAMSDTMFKQGADLSEVRGIVGHEMGHYVHVHVLWAALIQSLLAVLGFWLVDRLFAPALRLTGDRRVAGIADPAGLPVLVAILTVLGLLATPINSSLTRITEADADAFSLAHAHEPDGLSKGLIKTVTYRAPSPSWLEEVVFYDHPSIERRVRRAMEWKAAHPAEVGRQ